MFNVLQDFSWSDKLTVANVTDSLMMALSLHLGADFDVKGDWSDVMYQKLPDGALCIGLSTCEQDGWMHFDFVSKEVVVASIMAFLAKQEVHYEARAGYYYKGFYTMAVTEVTDTEGLQIERLLVRFVCSYHILAFTAGVIMRTDIDYVAACYKVVR